MILKRKKLVVQAICVACTLTGSLSANTEKTLPIHNFSMEAEKTSSIGEAPAGWSVHNGELLTLDASEYGYVDSCNGLDGSQIGFSTFSKDISGLRLEQTLQNYSAQDFTTYTMTVGIGERNFQTRFSGVTLQLRLEDGTILGSKEFGKSDIAPLFTQSGDTHEVVKVAARFNLNDVDNTQDLKIVILAGGGKDGGSIGRESIDIDTVSLSSSRKIKPNTPTLISIGGLSVTLRN